MKPDKLKTKIFLDGGDPKETKQLLAELGFLDGQTTNPTLVAKNPEAAKRLEEGKKFESSEIIEFYRQIVTEISQIIPKGSVSVEVYADKDTTAHEMLEQAELFFSWIPNAHIKYPTTYEGLIAAHESIKLGMRVNMTLVFTQSQAAAVYSATKGAKKGEVFVSPFIGRLDDQGESGMDLIKNILKMYESGDGHVEVLTASVRNMDHFQEAIKLGSDIITSPIKIIKEWSDNGKKIPGSEFIYNAKELKPIEYQELDLEKPWTEFDITHPLTDKGIEKFSADWNTLIRSST